MGRLLEISPPGAKVGLRRFNAMTNAPTSQCFRYRDGEAEETRLSGFFSLVCH